MSYLVLTVLRVLGTGFQSRRHLMLENLALRHQLAVFNRSAPKPRLRSPDRFLWVLLQRFWSGWHRSLVVVQPRTVVGWHRLGFRLFWRWKSRARGARPTVDRQLITLIRQMWSGNVAWGEQADPRGGGQTRDSGLGFNHPEVSPQRPPLPQGPNLDDFPPQSYQGPHRR